MAPLHHAAVNGCQLTMQLLIKSGAGVDAVDILGKTPLLWAVYEGHLNLVEELWEHSNVRLRDHNGSGPLHLAAITKPGDVKATLVKEAMVEMLIRRAADIEAKSRDGRTPLHLAVVIKSVPVVKLLIDNCADKEALDVNGRTPLHLAVVSGDEAVTRLLREEGADREARDGDERTPLHLAVVSGYEGIVRLLIECGADTGAMDRASRNTPLHLAVDIENVDMARMLIRAGPISGGRHCSWPLSSGVLAWPSCSSKKVQTQMLGIDGPRRHRCMKLSEMGTSLSLACC